MKNFFESLPKAIGSAIGETITIGILFVGFLYIYHLTNNIWTAIWCVFLAILGNEQIKILSKKIRRTFNKYEK